MATKKPIKCPCGRLLGETSQNHGAGTKVCPSCKKRVRYDITESKVHTCYQ